MLAYKQKRTNLQYKHQGGMNAQTPKEAPTTWHRKDTWLSREMSNRHFREENTSAKEDMRKTENLGRACPMSVLPVNAQQEESGTLTKPQRPRLGGRQHSPWLGPHIWACEESWGQQQGRDRCGEMLQSRASQLPHQQPHLIGLQFTGQGLVQSQDLEEQQQPTICSKDPPS